jgi:hypothetical protein
MQFLCLELVFDLILCILSQAGAISFLLMNMINNNFAICSVWF